MKLAAFVASAAIAASPAAAQQVDLSGALSGELRGFTQSAAFPGQSGDRLQPSISLEARAIYDWNGGADRIVVAPFLRWGGNGDGRDHADLREAYWLRQGDGWSLTAGIDKVFWGVTESRHLVDIINQDDTLEDIDGEDKLGQPMLNLNLYGSFGTVGVYVMPVFRKREFLNSGARLAGPVPITGPVYGSPDGARHVDWALRWSNSIGAWDLGLSYFQGTSREPRMVPVGPAFTPIYDQIRQAGIDAQWTSGNWLWKLEAINRSGQGPDFWAATAGFEKTFPGIGGSAIDLGLIAEWNYDGRDRSLAPATLYDNDLFLGARLGFNDIGSSSLLAGVLIDQDTDATIWTFEGQRRFGEDWVVSLEGRFFAGAIAPDPVAAILSDDYLALSFKRSF